MSCGCNSNFSGGGIDTSKYDSALASHDRVKITSMLSGINDLIKGGKAEEEQLPMLNEYMDKGKAKLQIIGQEIIISNTQNAIKSNEGNPSFPLAEYESKLAVATEKAETLKAEYEELTGDSTKESFFKKNKKIILLSVGVGVLTFIGYKLYVKYKK